MHIISSGLEPTVRHHYRAEKMALWLGLIPRLHRATGPAAASSTESLVSSVPNDSRYHQLDDEDNLASFEDDNDDKRNAASGHKPEHGIGNNNNGSHRSIDKTSTKKNIAADMSETAQSVETLGPVLTGSGRKSAKRTTTVVPIRHGTTTHGVPAAASIDGLLIMMSSQEQRRLPNNEEPSISGPHEPTHEHIALVATIATGCGALVLNCAVFAAVCVHRTRVSRRSKSLPIPPTIRYGCPGASSATTRTFTASSYKTAPNRRIQDNYLVSPYNGSSSLPVRNHRNGAPAGGHSIDATRHVPITSSPLDFDDPMSTVHCPTSSSTSTSWPPVGTASTLPPPPPPQRTAMASTLSSTSSTVDRNSSPRRNVIDENHYDFDNQDQIHQIQQQQHYPDYTIASLT